MPYPTFHFILVVDIEGFGKRTVPMQQSLRKAMYEVARIAFEDTNLDWDSVVQLDRGDAIIMLVPPSTANSVALAGVFVNELDAVLREKARMYTTEHEIRLRMALHQGLCQQDENGWVGEAINTACRLVDDQQLKDVLRAAQHARMVFIVSDEIHRGVVKHSFRHIDPASFAAVRIDAKELQAERAWIRVPGSPYPPGIKPPSDAPDDAPPVSQQPPGEVSSSRPAADARNVFEREVKIEGDFVGHTKNVYGGERPR